MAAVGKFVSNIQTIAQTIVNADGTSYKDLLTAGTGGSTVPFLNVATDDTANVTLQYAISVSGTDYPIFDSTVLLGSGTAGTAKALSALNPTDFPGVAYLEDGALKLAAGVKLRVKAKVAVTAAKTVYFTGWAGDYT